MASKTDTFDTVPPAHEHQNSLCTKSHASAYRNPKASNTVTVFVIELDLADVSLHLLSILNSLDRAIVEGRPGLIWIQ